MNIASTSISQTITNSTVIFSLIGLLTAVLFLLINAGMVAYTALHFPTPEVKNVVIKGFDKGPIKMFIDLEFPPTKMGYLISAQTEGPLDVSLFMSKKDDPLPSTPSATIIIKAGIDLNLASTKASRLAIDDLEVNLNNEFDSKIIADLMMAQVNKKQDMKIPNLKVQVNSRVILKSLWIPIAASISIPYNVDLTKLLMKNKKKTKTEEISNANEDSKVITKPSILSSRDELKKEAISKFDWKPRKVEITASDNSVFEIDLIGAIPSAHLPDFLTLSLPEIQLQVDFDKLLGHKKDDNHNQDLNGGGKIMGLRIQPILMQPSLDDPSKEIQIHATLRIEQSDAVHFQNLLKLARDQKFDQIGVKIRQPTDFIQKVDKNSFMYWLRDFVLKVPLGDLMEEQLNNYKMSRNQKKKIKHPSKPETQAENDTHLQTQTQTSIEIEAHRAVAIKFAHAKRIDPNGGEFLMQITISRAFVDFLSGKLPEVRLKSHLPDGTELVEFSISSEEINDKSENININLQLRVRNMKTLIYAALVGSGQGRNIGKDLSENKVTSAEVIKRFTEMSAIRTLQISGSDDNILSSFANIFSVDVKIGDEGLQEVTFRDSKMVIYEFEKNKKDTDKKEDNSEDNTDISINEDDKSKTKSKTTAAAKRKIKMYFAIENQEKHLNIGASIELKKQPYFGEYAHIGWGHFGIGLIYESKKIFDYNIQAGSLDVGFSQGIRPFSGNFVTGISIPADPEHLTNLKQFLDKFLNNEDEFIDFTMEILYQGQSESILLDSQIPSKKLMTKMSEIRPTNRDKPDKKDEMVVKGIKDDVKDKSTQKQKIIPSIPIKETFLSNISNMILRLISIQAPTLIFHASYPNLNFCSKESTENYDDLISVTASIPTIEVNVCQKDGNCFARAGTSRPIIFKGILINGEICNLQSRVLEADTQLPDAFATKHTTPFIFENNEIPIFASVTNLPILIQVVDAVGVKKPQSFTIKHEETSSNLNKVIGTLSSSFVNIDLPSKEEGTKKEKIDEKKPESADKVKREFSTLPSRLEIGSSSKSSQELDLTIGFRLPEGSLKGIDTGVSEPKNHFKWPIIQWGHIDYKLGVVDIFDLQLSINRGEIDLKKEGIVVPALENMAVRIKMNINPKFYIGSTAIRQIVGFINRYVSSPSPKEPIFNPSFVPKVFPKADMIYYDFVMDGPRGVDDHSQLQAAGEFKVTSVFEMLDIIANRPKNTVEVAKTAQLQNNNNNEKNPNPFKDIRVALKSNLSEKLPVLNLPCLMPAICSDQELRDENYKTTKQSGTVNLSLELFNALKPATEILSKSLGPVMEMFKMSEYPSKLQFQFTSLSDISTTVLLDGSGMVSLKLAPFEFSRTVSIPYKLDLETDVGKDHHVLSNDKSASDIFTLNVDLGIPKTIIGIRSTLNVFRAETLLQPSVPPVYIYSDEKKEMKKLILSNQPINVGFSSDYPLQEDNRKEGNLLSALANSFLKDLTIPGLGQTDVQSDSQIQIQQKTDEKAVSVKKEKEQGSPSSGLGYISTASKAAMLSCATTGLGCSRLDLVYNVDLPFNEERFEVIFPETGIVRVLFDDVPIVQVVADAKRSKHLIFSKRTGISALGTISAQLTGLNENEFGSKGSDFDKIIAHPESKASSTNLFSYFLGKNNEKAKFSVHVLLGHDVSFTTDIHFSLPKIITYARKHINVGEIAYSAASNYISSFWSSKQEQNVPINPKPKTQNKSIDSNIRPLVSETDPEHLTCIDPDLLSSKERNNRLNKVEFKNSFIFYESGQEHISILPNKKFKLFLQLRTADEEQICGQVHGAERLGIQLRRLEDKQGFVKVERIFGLNSPKADYLKTIHYSTFNEISSVYEFKDITLPHSGRYEVSIVKDKITYDLPNTVVYVKNEY